MEPQGATNLCQEALWQAFTIALPILGAGIVVGFLVGIFQAMTQIQEQTLAVVAKLIVMSLVIAWFLPWITGRLLEYSRFLIENIPDRITPVL